MPENFWANRIGRSTIEFPLLDGVAIKGADLITCKSGFLHSRRRDRPRRLVLCCVFLPSGSAVLCITLLLFHVVALRAGEVGGAEPELLM